MSDKSQTCATCRWRGTDYHYMHERRRITIYCCNHESNGTPTGRCFVMDDFSCPRWERREDLADRVARAADEYFNGSRFVSPDIANLAAVIRPLLEEGKP